MKSLNKVYYSKEGSGNTEQHVNTKYCHTEIFNMLKGKKLMTFRNRLIYSRLRQ